MIVYFLLIGFASLLVGAEFVADTHSATLTEELMANFDRFVGGEIDEKTLFEPIERLRSKAILMLCIILFVVVIVLTMFIRHITEPLQHMIETSKEISEGDLSRSVTIHSRNELSEMGNVINEMASNLQEIILLTQRVCSSGRTLLDSMTATGSPRNTNDDEVAGTGKFNSDLTLLCGLIDHFKFYTLDPNDGS
jgi:methyl-accepting chemotaxis protein